ncbi:MAG: 50S ribosomal protein L28 [bacterium]|nr:50S ribosomal protein L28 [bacterium]
MAKCHSCRKGAQHILKVSHSKQRTSKWSKPNLHSTTIQAGGQKKKVKLCTKCLRRHKAQTKQPSA